MQQQAHIQQASRQANANWGSMLLERGDLRHCVALVAPASKMSVLAAEHFAMLESSSKPVALKAFDSAINAAMQSAIESPAPSVTECSSVNVNDPLVNVHLPTAFTQKRWWSGLFKTLRQNPGRRM
jgi:hypothetical protein